MTVKYCWASSDGGGGCGIKCRKPFKPKTMKTNASKYETSPQSSTSDSASDSEVWSPRSSVSSVSSNDSTNISPRANLGRSYLKTLGCSKTISTKSQSLASSCLSKRCASPLSIIAACNDRKRIPSMSDSPASMDEVRPTSSCTSSTVEEDQEWSSNAGTIDPKLLQLNSSALTAVKGLCSLSQRATVFQPPPSSSFVHGGKRTFGKSYSMGHVQSDYEPAKRRRGALSDQTLARML